MFERKHLSIHSQVIKTLNELAFDLEIKILNQRYLFYRLTKSLQQEIQSSKQLYELWRNK